MNEINQINQPNTPEQPNYESEHEILLKMQYELLMKKLADSTEPQISYEMFSTVWKLCEEYMMQVVKYAIHEMNNKSTDNSNDN